MAELNETEQLAVDRLDELEALVLSFDRARGRSEDWRPLVHSLFRETHNLKSALAMAGRDGAAGVMHELETRLDELRSGKRLPDDSWTDAMLNAVDAARSDMLSADSADGGSGLEAAVARLTALIQPSPGAAVRPDAPELEIGFPLSETEAEELKFSSASGEKLFILEKLIAAEMPAEKTLALPIFGTLRSSGRIIAWRSKSAGTSGSVLSVLFSSALSSEDLTFEIFDPFYPVAAPVNKEPVKIPRLLIVDDDSLTILVLQHYLSAFGRVDTATRGEEALEKFQSAVRKEPYAVVFLDIMMPHLDGHQTLEQLRGIEQAAGVLVGEGCRVVMASALADFSSISSSFRGQCDAYLVKPFNRTTVAATMRKFGCEPIPMDDSIVPARADARAER